MASKIIISFEPWAWLVLVFSLIFGFGPAALDWLGRLEGRLFPVLAPTLIIEGATQTLDPLETIISGKARKVRGHCVYERGSLRWYLGDPEGLHVNVSAQFLDAPALRGQGWTAWQAIMVGLPVAQVRGRSFATVTHRCGAPWRTVSTFYLSTSKQIAEAPNDP